jgi:hypothetical protein
MCLNQDQKIKPLQPHVCQTFQLRLEKLVYLIKQVLFQLIGYRIIEVDILANIFKSMSWYVWSASENLLKMKPSGWVVFCVFCLTVACVDTLKSSILQKNLVIVLESTGE